MAKKKNDTPKAAAVERKAIGRRLHVYFSGTVQGVGFRYTAQSVSGRFPVTGWVRNRSDGRVEMVAEGEPDVLESFLQAIGDGMAGYIDGVERTWDAATGEFNGFIIEKTV